MVTVETIINMNVCDRDGVSLVNDNTEIFISKDLSSMVHAVIAHGNWYQDNILAHMEDEVESFTWQNDNAVFIDVK